MGNNRTTNTPISPETFTTSAGVEIPTDGHSQEWMKKLDGKIKDWVRGIVKSPSQELNEDELDYVLENMEDSEGNPLVPSGHLTRAEYAYHLLPLIESGEINVGDIIPDISALRSYSRTQQATLDIIHGWEKPTIIFRTNDNTKHFNATKYFDMYEEEKESLVHQQNMRIDKITVYNKNEYSDYENDFSYEYNKSVCDDLGVIEQPISPEQTIVIDVSPAK